MYNLSLTNEVYAEVLAGKSKLFPDALLVEKLKNEQKIKIEIADSKLTKKFEQDFKMGAGEASIVSAGVNDRSKIVVTDNRQGRIAAKINNLQLAGSLDLIVALYQQQKVSKEKAMAALKTLQEEGWFEPLLIEIAREEIK
jgi:predicted nucleic acid-binding protein